MVCSKRSNNMKGDVIEVKGKKYIEVDDRSDFLGCDDCAFDSYDKEMECMTCVSPEGNNNYITNDTHWEEME